MDVVRSRRLRFGSFEMDEAAGELCKHGSKIRLQEQPLQILQILLERPGEVVSRDELRNRIWPSDTFVDFDHGINNAIKRLREVLGDTAETPHFIETLPRRGYRFIAQLESIVNRFHSLVVLPLENLSGDPEQEYFADGLTEALITNLAKISAIRVVSRTTAIHYKGTRQSLPTIASELGVDAVIEGTVMRSADRVRISVQLIDARSDAHLWAESYERDLRDVLALHADVARAIASEIQIKITPVEKMQLTQVREVDPEIYDAYLRGRFHFNKRKPDGLLKSIEYFQQAIEKDPGYAPAYAGLADSTSRLGFWDCVSPEDGCGRAKSAALKALAIDDNLADAHASLAFAALNYDYAFAYAEEEGRRATRLDPRSPGAAQAYACCLAAQGRMEEAVAEILRAVQLDPFALVLYWNAGALIFQARQYERAIAQSRKAVAMDPTFPPTHWTIAFALAEMHEYDAAIEEAWTGVVLANRMPIYLGALGYVYGRAGKQEDAIAILKELQEVSARRYVSSFWLGVIHTSLGNRDAAFQYLERAYQEHAPMMAYFKVLSLFDDLRPDPRFGALLRQMNYPE
jgi:TolB-like protein/Flp pilus assembly protein TadD